MRTGRDPTELLDAFRRVSDGVFAADEQMRVVYWNRAATRIFGVDAASALGRRCDELIQGYESSGAALCSPECGVICQARRGQAAATYDLVRAGGEGKRQWLNVSIVVLRGRNRASTLAVHLVRDVTGRRNVEARASRTLSKLPVVGMNRNLPTITKREAEVIRLLACGLSNQEIAETLGITATTVRNHIEHLLAKLSVHSKLEAVVVAARGGLL